MSSAPAIEPTPAHTAGPWNARGLHVLRDPQRDGRAIANVDRNDFGTEASHANARLIAAAPDLLEALRAMVDRWEPDCIGTDRVMWENARAAIAKATQP